MKPRKPKRIETINFGIVLEGFTTTIQPQDDFYHDVNGKWLDEFDLAVSVEFKKTNTRPNKNHNQ